MAGIGFVLRKLAKKDDLLGIIRACIHSAMVSTGPWLFTVFAIGTIVIFSSYMMKATQILNFQIIVIYNFAFSLVISGPFFMIATRFLADAIHLKDLRDSLGMLYGTLFLLLLTEIPLGIWFYFIYANISFEMALLALINFIMISGIWQISVFLSAIKNYRSITLIFFTGMLSAVIFSSIFGSVYKSAGLLSGLNCGLAIILFSLLGRIFLEYPYQPKRYFSFLPYFRKYWQLALGGLVYNSGIWVDKWIMWFSPESELLDSGFRTFPLYDTAMFIAYLTIVPVMALFVFSIETSFFEAYIKFYRDIQEHGTFKTITQNHYKLIQTIVESTRNFFIIQASVAFIVTLISPTLFKILNLNYQQLGIFRFGVLGAFFNVLMLFITIFLSYFDSRNRVIFVQITFLITNALFTWFTLDLPISYYGIGYLGSSIITFIIAAILFAHYVKDLPYHTFITTNLSVKPRS